MLVEAGSKLAPVVVVSGSHENAVDAVRLHGFDDTSTICSPGSVRGEVEVSEVKYCSNVRRLVMEHLQPPTNPVSARVPVACNRDAVFRAGQDVAGHQESEGAGSLRTNGEDAITLELMSPR